MLRTTSTYLDLLARMSRGQPTGEDLVRYQSRRLRRLVRHAYERVPYYRRLFDQHRLRPQDIRGLEDLSKIPITQRRDLQVLPSDQIVARGVDPNRLEIHRTSGSAGEPFAVRRTLSEDRFLFALRLRAFHQLGWRRTDRWAHIGSVRPSHPRSGLSSRLLKRVGRFRPQAFNSTGPIEAVIPKLREFRPDTITGYPNALARMALLLTDDDRRFIKPRLVVTESEVLTPLMREQIRSGFRAPTFEFYASWEFNVMGWECPTSGELHACEDTVILEVLADGMPVPEGGRGEVVVTGLHSFAMPLIRYRLADVVTRGRPRCACGGPYSTIRAVQGRMIDLFPLPDGRLLHPYEISKLVVLVEKPWVRQYQLTQERRDHIVLRAVPLSPPSPEQLASVRERVAELLGPQVTFDVVLTSEIPPEASGKYRVARSLVESAY